MSESRIQFHSIKNDSRSKRRLCYSNNEMINNGMNLITNKINAINNDEVGEAKENARWRKRPPEERVKR